MSGNGEKQFEEILLKRDPATGEVSLTSNVHLSIDQILNILLQAYRHIEVKFRIMAALNAQAEIAQMKADQEMAEKLMGKH